MCVCVCRSQYNRNENIRRHQKEKLYSDLQKNNKKIATIKCGCDTSDLSNKRVLGYTFSAEVKP